MNHNEYIARRLWAKTEPFHYLWRHLLDAAAVAEMLLPRFVPEGSLPLSKLWLCYLVAMHDIGKADPLFQFKARENTEWEKIGFPVFKFPFAEQVDFEAWVAAKLNANVDFEKTTGFRHEARSYEWLESVNLPQTHGWGINAASVAATAIRGHHADFDAEVCAEENYTAKRWNPIREALAKLVADVIGLKGEAGAAPQDFSEQNASRVGLILSGLIVLSDWIASNDALYPYPTISHIEEPIEYFVAARKLAADAIKKLQFDTVSEHGATTTPAFSDVWRGDNYRSLRPTQKTLEKAVQSGEIPPGLAIIEAPMGEGKTEAAIYLAEVWNRLTGRVGNYIALPTQATSNQMFGRYQEFIANTRPSLKPRLLHGMAWLREEEKETAQDAEGATQTFGVDGAQESERAREWFFDNAKRGLLATESVGTVDQALFAALNVRHGFLRLFGLSTRTLIVDEAHAYDEFMSAILCRLLQWLYALRVPTILLSATLSQAQKAKLLYAWNKAQLPDETEVAYPLITVAPFDNPPKSAPLQIPVEDYDRKSTVTLRKVPGLLQDAPRTAQFATNLVQGGGCLCVLVNTVAQAQAVFANLVCLQKEGYLPEGCDLSLFHARFPAKGRNKIEKDVLQKFGKGKDGQVENPNRPRCAILIATQVVEQSLDVDFDAMISEIAPIDLLLQRSGRMHRHAGRTRPSDLQLPILYVLVPETSIYEFGTTGKVYQPYILLRTLAHLIQGEEAFVFHAPDDFRSTIEAVYGADTPLADVPLADAITAAKDEWLRETATKDAKAGIHLVAEPRPAMFRYAPDKPAVDEDAEGESPRSYFRAKTRDDDGEPTLSVLILTETDDFRAWQSAKKTPDKKQPSNWVLRQLFLCKASVPARWLKGVPEMPDGAPAPRWLNKHTVLLMKNHEPGLFRFEDNEGIIRLWSDNAQGLYEEKRWM